MAFTTWRAEYNRAQEALAGMSWDAYFVSSVENNREMRTTYTRLGNITGFIDWLLNKAIEEEQGFSSTGGSFMRSVGGN